MNKNFSPNLARALASIAAKTERAQSQARDTPEAKRYRQEQAKFAAKILSAANSAKSVEDLVFLEVTLQKLDEEQAKTDQDSTGIENAKRDYAQIFDTLEQMRTHPSEYFKANKSMKETGGDFRKIPRSRCLQQLSGNITRMRNRASFASEEDRMVWDARIAIAEKTEGMLKTLHKKLVVDHERTLKAQD